MSGFHLRQIGACMRGTHTHPHPHTTMEGPHTTPTPHTSPDLETLAPRSLFSWHFDLLVTSFFPGLFSSSTRASPTALTGRNDKGLFIQGDLAAGPAGRQEKDDASDPQVEGTIHMYRAHRVKGGFLGAGPMG